MVDEYLEDCVEPTSMLYSCPHVAGVQHVVPLNVGTPPMRGPGRTPALFAIESAMDELAIKLNMDPLELRLRNYAETDESSQRPWSSKHLREAYEIGAARFGWSKRNPQVGSMRRGAELLGWGMATCTWPGHQMSAEVRVRLLADGTAQAACATQDIGTGTYGLRRGRIGQVYRWRRSASCWDTVLSHLDQRLEAQRDGQRASCHRASD